MVEFKRKHDLGLVENKKMVINDIYGIEIEKFRLFQDQNFELGKRITVVSGRNGTMKSTLMGLVAQPFRTDFTDINEKVMQTKFSEVFKLSEVKDAEDYVYHLKLNVNNDLALKEPIPLYYQPGNPDSKTSKKGRHRLVPSGRAKGDGYFRLPSVYINLKRLYPLIDSGEIRSKPFDYSTNEKKFISELYQSVLLRSDFDNFEKYSTDFGKGSKNPYGPEGSYYDVNSISSGEDNLSMFADAMISFMRIFQHNKDNNIAGLTGIFSIDEFEASLHPVAQVNLFNFLYWWSNKYNVKIILNTHSLFLIQNIYLSSQDKLEHKEVIINFIASHFESDNHLSIFQNPPYGLAYSELTLSNYAADDSPLVKVKILCEDDIAQILLKRIIRSSNVISQIIFSHVVNVDNPGTSWTLLASLCKSFPSILEETRSIVVFDADVPEKKVNSAKYEHSLMMPSLYGLPFEKEIVKYILSLDGSHNFFKNFKKTKEMFRQEFASAHIDLSTDKYDQLDVKPFKKWYTENKKEGQKYMTYYVNNNRDLFDSFKAELVEHINTIRVKNGFMPIKY